MKALKFESTTYIEYVETAIHNCYTISVEPSNEQLMALYQTIGQAIVSQGEKAFVVFLADYLKCNFPSLKGFSPRNLRRMRNFYLTYQNNASLMMEALQLNWTQNVIIMEYCESNEERSFYIDLVGKAKLSKLALIAEIEMESYQISSHQGECNFSIQMQKSTCIDYNENIIVSTCPTPFKLFYHMVNYKRFFKNYKRFFKKDCCIGFAPMVQLNKKLHPIVYSTMRNFICANNCYFILKGRLKVLLRSKNKRIGQMAYFLYKIYFKYMDNSKVCFHKIL